jgi:hypothetical protein
MQKTISVQGYEFRVDFDYEPAEPRTWHHPGCSESVSINDVWDSDGDKIKEWAYDILENDIEIGCLEAVQIDQEEAQMSEENAKMRAWEARQEFKFENWD